jgi:hypothetical protein
MGRCLVSEEEGGVRGGTWSRAEEMIRDAPAAAAQL